MPLLREPARLHCLAGLIPRHSGVQGPPGRGLPCLPERSSTHAPPRHCLFFAQTKQAHAGHGGNPQGGEMDVGVNVGGAAQLDGGPGGYDPNGLRGRLPQLNAPVVAFPADADKAAPDDPEHDRGPGPALVPQGLTVHPVLRSHRCRCFAKGGGIVDDQIYMPAAADIDNNAVRPEPAS